MDDQLRKIRKLTAFMKKAGIIHLKQDNIELSLVPQAIDLPRAEPEIDPNAIPPVQYTADDALFWSAPGFPDEANQ